MLCNANDVACCGFIHDVLRLPLRHCAVHVAVERSALRQCDNTFFKYKEGARDSCLLVIDIYIKMIRQLFPYFFILFTEIVEKVKSGPQGCNALMRPDIMNSGDSDVEDKRILQLVQICWSEDPLKRPNINDVRGYLRKINKGK